MHKYLHVAFNFDANYYRQAIVAISSLLVCARNNEKYDIHYDLYLLITEDVTSEIKAEIKNVLNKIDASIVIHFIDVTNYFHGAHETRGISRVAYMRLMLHRLLDIDTVIYSDVDVIFQTDLSEFADLDFSSYIYGGIKDIINNLPRKRKWFDDSYFYTDMKNIGKNYRNSGFLILNLQKIREMQLDDRILELSKKQYVFQDQDIINILYSGNQKEVYNISPQYCVLSSHYSEMNYEEAFENDIISYKELLEVKNDPKIIHYAGDKPWDTKLERGYIWWNFVKTYTPYYKYFKKRFKKLSKEQKNWKKENKIFSIRDENEHKTLYLLGGKIKWRTPLQKVLPVFRQMVSNQISHLSNEVSSLRSENQYLKDLLADNMFEQNKILLNKGEKAKIYFLFHSHAFWASWQSLFEACKNDSKIEVKFIYCPVKEQPKAYNGQFENIQEWLDDHHIDYTPIENWDYSIDIPHVLVIQTPYDCHRPSYYSIDTFRNLGMRIVYISYGLEFTEANENIYNHFQLPIHKKAWRIYTFCNNLVKDYQKYCPKGNHHVRCLGHPKFDALFNSSNMEMPTELKNKIAGRKVVVWHVHFPCNYSVQNGQPVLSTFSWEDNKAILQEILKRKDLFFIFMPHHMFFGAFRYKYNVLPSDIYQFKQMLEQSDNTAIWYDDYTPVLSWADAFLGERSAVTMEAMVTDKPICYLEKNPEQYNEFGKDVVNATYYAQTPNDVVQFLDSYQKGVDGKRKDRSAVREKYFTTFYDGKCGERIKDDILNTLEIEANAKRYSTC